MRMAMISRHVLYGLSVLFGLIVLDVQARQYIPKNDGVVVEVLKKDVRQIEIQNLRRTLAADPNNLRLAVVLAKRYISESRNTGDPRYLGYAQAALAPWWKNRRAPPEVAVIRATILQSTHQFTAALDDLNFVLEVDRDDPQAWLTKATVQQVTGDFAGAKLSCERLKGLAPEIIAVTCKNQIGSLSGDLENSYKALVEIYKKNEDADPSIRIWVVTLLAEMSVRKDDVHAAESWFKKAMSIDEPDGYLLGAYADFLLDHGRQAEVVSLLRNKTRNDALLLRYVMALKTLRLPSAEEQRRILQQRFDAAAMREDSVHQREHARFELHVNGQSTTALDLAKKNWAVQKEPADLRIYLECALASKDSKAAEPALTWLKNTKLQDKSIQELASKLGGIM